jgi:hypothetical protein
MSATPLLGTTFIGEGHRKVWARLRILRYIRVSRARVLHPMRENALPSPHRHPQGMPNLHDGAIATDRPNDMWGTDGTRLPGRTEYSYSQSRHQFMQFALSVFVCLKASLIFVDPLCFC